MASINVVTLVGNITRDAELRYTPGGTAVTDLGVAINERRRVGEEWQEETTFVDVTVWGKTAEVVCEQIGKGDTVAIQGRLKLDTWEADGEKRAKLKVVCENIQFLTRKRANNTNDTEPEKPNGKKDSVPF